MTRIRILTVLFTPFILGGFAPTASAHYRPGTGRWLERDPLGEPHVQTGATVRIGSVHAGRMRVLDARAKYRDGMNLYEYAQSNPIGNRDPYGLYFTTDPDEKLKRRCVFWCGVIPCNRAYNHAEDALKKAEDKFPDSVHNGAGDAFRHCYWSCKMQQDGWLGGGFMRVVRCGINCAKKIADMYEDKGDEVGQLPEERQMDEHNNHHGREIGRSGKDCEKGCEEALRAYPETH